MKVKTSPPMEFYKLGEEVFYKHGKDNAWHGPGKIIGLDNKVIIIRQGRFILSTSQSRIIRATGAVNMQMNQSTNTQTAPAKPNQNLKPTINQSNNESFDSDDDSEDEEANEDETREDEANGRQDDTVAANEDDQDNWANKSSSQEADVTNGSPRSEVSARSHKRLSNSSLDSSLLDQSDPNLGGIRSESELDETLNVKENQDNQLQEIISRPKNEPKDYSKTRAKDHCKEVG